MSEEEQNLVEQTSAADTQTTDDNVVQDSSPPKDSSQERNWREMRQTMDELKRRNYELEAHIGRVQPQSQEQEEEVFTDDDISTVGMTKKLIQKEAAKIAQKIVRQREAQTVEERLRLKYSDYDYVVNKENLDSLYSAAPEVVKMLQSNQEDPYEQASAAYKLLKKFGKNSEDSQKLKENQQKPRSVQSVGQNSPLSEAHAFSKGLTPDLRKQLWEEMKEASKQA